MRYKTYSILLLLLTTGIRAQDGELPYRQIPPSPGTYTAGTVVARMIDGLGFRYFWATEGLSEADKDFRLSEDSRSVLELMQHIHGLTVLIENSSKKVANGQNNQTLPPLGMDQLRMKTLEKLKASAMVFGQSPDLNGYPLLFHTSEGTSKHDFWHQVNGPIADAIWHCGQIAILRRANGNPLPAGVDFFMGSHKK
jgi:hypothetical protein